MKKRIIVIAIIAAVAGVGCLVYLNWLSGTRNTNMLKRQLADVRDIATVLQKYCREHGAYPATSDVQEFRQSVSPKYIRNIDFIMSYDSDGTNYACVFRPMSFAGATPQGSLGVIEVYNGRILSWPDFFDEEEVRWLEQRLIDMHLGCPRTTTGKEGAT